MEQSLFIYLADAMEQSPFISLSEAITKLVDSRNGVGNDIASPRDITEGESMSAADIILAAAAAGNLTFRGKADADGRSDPKTIEPNDVQWLHFLSDIEAADKAINKLLPGENDDGRVVIDRGEGVVDEIPQEKTKYEGSELDNLYTKDVEQAWKEIKVERRSFENWLRGLNRDNQSAMQEKLAITELVMMLKSDTTLTKKTASEALRKKDIVVSGAGFQKRIWSQARKEAGLTEKGKPGRRPRSEG